MLRDRSATLKLPRPLVPLSDVLLVLGISRKSFYRRGFRDIHTILVWNPAPGEPGRTGRSLRESRRRQRGEPQSIHSQRGSPFGSGVRQVNTCGTALVTPAAPGNTGFPGAVLTIETAITASYGAKSRLPRRDGFRLSG